jgi:acetyl-CoA carboxylase carboxyltransferase component
VSDDRTAETTLTSRSPVLGTVVKVSVAAGDRVAVGDTLVVTESMKMEYVVSAEVSGQVRRVVVAVGAQVAVGDPLVSVTAGEIPVDGEEVEEVADSGGVDPAQAADAAQAVDPATPIAQSGLRPELAEVLDRQARTLDAARPEAVARRTRRGRRTARMNIDDLCDPGSFTEYGSLVVAAQRARRSLDDLIANTPADGLVSGIARINGDRFPDELSRCAVVSYDYMVLAGTQGQLNHRKKDRLFELVERLRLPVVLFAEGGGGRPGDTDTAVVTGLDTTAFALFGTLSGLVPTIGIASGRCFAGNAALLGCCDVIIATPDASIGMAGPAMIEGGGLGTFTPEEIGPIEVQRANGVVDVVASDDADAVRLAKQYLSYFQGPIDHWECVDQLELREVVPPSRVRVYDMHTLVELVADTGSVLELRAGFGLGMVTALVRIEGRPVGVVANNPLHLGGAIDADGADKAARFLQLCDAHDLPVLFLCDTPGFMVGPEAEATAQVRHVSRLFVVGASLTVPFMTVVVRKGYGLGAQAMAGGSFRSPLFTVAWPTGELGGMGLEGAVQLGFRRELEAIEDPEEREAAFQSMVDRAYQHGRALNVASVFEIDDVIDPAATRHRVVETLRASPPPPARSGKKRSFIDTW